MQENPWYSLSHLEADDTPNGKQRLLSSSPSINSTLQPNQARHRQHSQHAIKPAITVPQEKKKKQNTQQTYPKHCKTLTQKKFATITLHNAARGWGGENRAPLHTEEITKRISSHRAT